jgi:hypothetical protein
LLVLSGLAGVLASCSSQDADLLKVRHYHLQDVDAVDLDSAMARGEQMYRLRGAVTMVERRSRLGHYYSVDWKKGATTGNTADLSVEMDYLQSATASKVLHMSCKLPKDAVSGKVEFQVTGESYRVGGQVLAWRIRLMQGDRVLAEKRSYLWK